MKKTFTKALFVVLIAILSFCAISCAGKQDTPPDDSDPRISAVYEAYVADATARDETPLSYEEWFASIKGERGDKGDNGLSAYEIYRKHHPVYDGTEEEWINDLASGKIADSYKTGYNIVFTLATIPPVLSSLDCITNGYETYAYIERGKTYNGIDGVNGFHNIGFNVNSNNSTGFTAEAFGKVLDVINNLNVYGNEKFNVYVQDGTALYGAMLAANAQLSDSQYKVVMVEDGTGAYNALSSILTTYDDFAAYVSDTKKQLDGILASNENAFASYYDIAKAFALAADDNFEYLLQSENQVETIVKATGDEKLAKYFGFGTDEGEKLNLRYGSISEFVSSLPESRRTDYLTLMYGSAYEGTHAALTRTADVAGVAVPSKKLAFIGTRVSGYPEFVTNASVLGIGKLTDDVPTYANLDDKYKTPLLFANEADYAVLYNALYDDSNYGADVTDNEKKQMRVACFNNYANYAATLKFVYAQYGAEYDVIMKGHPRETMDSYVEWNYSAAGKSYSLLMFNAAKAFHNSDSVGKRLGLMPYGTAAENLAYLGINLSIGGLPSSTYTGYETSVDVNFVLAITDNPITGDGNLNSRYEAGNLVYHEGDEVKITRYYNTGLIYKTLAQTEGAQKEAFAALYEAWIRRVKGVDDASGYEVNDQGFIVEKTV